MPQLPLVSVGLPVYNGMPHLRRAVETLLAQTYPNLEIVLSDNASTDGTSEYCQALAQVHPRVRHVRNERNLGAIENFRLALERAQGEYFMWASHDDQWCEHYASALTDSLLADPEAVLATPSVLHVAENGRLRNEPPDRPATGQSAKANLKLLYEDHAASWVYGLWRRDWLRQHFAEYQTYPFWGADVLWLADICLSAQVVGDQRAVIYKCRRPSPHAPRSARAAVAMWGYMAWHLGRISLRRTSGLRERAETLAMSGQYVYRLCIRRPHLARTVWRVVRMLTIAAATTAVLAAARGVRGGARRLRPALDFAARRPV
jgi:glycosyltransferase involved in cell wall biosynthesis